MVNEVVQQIWQACEGKHDSIIRTLYDIIIVILPCVSKDTLAFLYKKLNEIDLKNFNELNLNLLKEFTENVMNLEENSININENTVVSEEIVEEQFFGVNILWSLILDENPLSSSLNDEALQSFKNLIYSQNFKSLRTYFLLKSIKEIEKGSSIPQCIFVIMRIIQTNSLKKADNESLSMRAILMSYEKNFNLLGLIIKDIYRYFQKVRTEFQEYYRKSPSTIFDEIFEGKHSHRTNLDMRLHLLEQFAAHNLLAEGHLDALWEVFVLNALDYQESVLYFKWLARQNENAKGEIQTIFPKTLLTYQFDQILCNNTKNCFKLMREESFNLFYLFFVVVNLHERNLKINKNGKLAIISPNIHGLNILWKIFNEIDREKVIEKCCELLSDLHLRISTSNPKEDKQRKRETAEKFTTYVMGLLKDACLESNKPMINKSAYLLIMFFEKFEGKFFKSSVRITNNYNHFVNLAVILKPENIQKEIRVNIYDQIGNFRKKISEEFEIPLNQFRIVRKNEGIGDSDDDEMTMREFGGLGGVYFIAKKKNENEDNYHPKHLISESQEYLDLLFKLLSESDTGNLISTLIYFFLKIALTMFGAC